MNQRLTNVLLVMAVALLYIVLGAYSGRTSVNGGLGPEGPIYAAMITAHDVQGGTVGNRVWPAFPLAAAVAYAVTGSVETSFVIVGFIAALVLAYAACRILDVAEAPPAIKVCAVLTLGVLGLPTAITAFIPAQPYLLGVAMTTLAIAAIESLSTRFARSGQAYSTRSARSGQAHSTRSARSGQAGGWLFMAAAQVGATLASPVGIMAPLYGLAKNWQARERRGALVAAMLPGLMIWLLVQVWARGGPAGLLDLLRLSRVHSDAVLWTESAFILFGAYFLLTTLGGLTVLLWSRPRWIQETLRDRPALWALLVPPLVFIATAGLEVPPMTAFLIPFWLIAIAGWARRQTAPLLVPVLLAGAMTILTQHPWRKVTDVSYFADWFPYSLHAARVSAVTMSDAMLTDIWRVRIFIAVAGLVASVAWWRRNIRQP